MAGAENLGGSVAHHRGQRLVYWAEGQSSRGPALWFRLY